MDERRAVVKAFAAGYRRARKGKKVEILDRFVEATGYHRTYAAQVLRGQGKRILTPSGVVLQGEARVRKKRQREKRYGPEVVRALTRLWILLDGISGKRLVPALREAIPALEAHGELHLAPAVREKLLRLSPATADRLLAAEKRKYALKRRSLTKPGTLLKHQIPIRTFADWDENRPGFLEVDLVSHEGGDASGDFCCTLDAVDIATTWTEQVAVRNKAQIWTFEGITEIQKRLPFEVLGLDSDNGSEFINRHLLQYCEEEKIQFTRSRPYRKNDSCHIEQKNWSIVRRFVGYARFDTDEQCRLLNELYKVLRLYTNFWLPTLRLKEKVRDGAKVTRRYETPMTPYQRVLASPHIPEETKQGLRDLYNSLNPAQLHRQIVALQAKIASLGHKNNAVRPSPSNPAPVLGGVKGKVAFGSRPAVNQRAALDPACAPGPSQGVAMDGRVPPAGLRTPGGRPSTPAPSSESSPTLKTNGTQYPPTFEKVFP